MAKDRKIRLCIVFGGKSGEHEVSLTSAASVISALDPDEFVITAIGITKAGKLAGASEMQKMLPPQLLARVDTNGFLNALGDESSIDSACLEESRSSKQPLEIIFPLLHGPYGEDGAIQGLLEIAGLPYIGCGVLASAAGMDKDIMKKLFLQAGLPSTPYRTIFSRQLDKEMDAIKQSVSEEFGFPVFSKPANLGSSVGVYKIHSEREFEESIKRSAQFDRKVLIEKGIDGRELECAILGNDEAQASVVGEVFSAHEFYDYGAKYVNPDSRLEIPARISDETANEVRKLALQAFKAIDGSGLARVDFFLDRKTNKIWINEINTMPGFTPISMYTKLWAASGVPFEELVRRLVQFGKERYREKCERKIE